MYLGFSPLSETLPVFVREEEESALYYAPGFVLRVDQSARPALEAELLGGKPRAAQAVQLLERAQAAKRRWAVLASPPFVPICLTLYLENRCNLRCAYCYSDPQSGGSVLPVHLRLETIRAAAELVARNCRASGQPFTVVFHGGGEPTLNRRLLYSAVEVVEEVAGRCEVTLFKYIATNGVMPAERAWWIAKHFDLIGLSCDGPAEIQNNQRPTRRGARSLHYVTDTAAILHQMNTPFHARVTVTPQTIARQEEIVDYVCQRLAPQEIHLEPVYTGGREQEGFGAAGDLAETFAAHFLQAQNRAAAGGIPLLFSGSRPWDVHGPFCQIFRGVLQLVPGQAVSPCFKLSDLQQVQARDALIGSDAGEGLVIDQQKVYAVRERLLRQPDACQGCFNQYHCARACPDGCGLESDQPNLPSFRCQVQMRLASAVIERAASALTVSSLAPLAAAPIRMGT